MADEDAVAPGGVPDQDVGHGPHQPSALEDGGAAHALDDAPGELQKTRVCHHKTQIPALLRVQAHRLDLHAVAAGLAVLQAAEDLRGAGPHLAAGRQGQSLPGQGLVRRVAEEASLRVLLHPAQGRARVPLAQKGAWSADLPPADPGEPGLRRLPAPDLQKTASAVVDPVAQGSKEARLRVIEGKGAQTGHPVPDPQPQPQAARPLLRLQGEGHPAAVSLYLQNHLPAALHLLPQGLSPLQGRSVHRQNAVSRPQPRRLGRGVLPLQLHHVDSVRLQLQPHGLPQGDQTLRPRRPSGDGQQQTQPYGRRRGADTFSHANPSRRIISASDV